MNNTPVTHDLDEPYLSVTRNTDNTVTLTDNSSPTPVEITFTEHQVVTITKLLDIGDGALPEHHGSRQFTLSDLQAQPSEHLAITGTNNPTLVVTHGHVDKIVIPPLSVTALHRVLTRWGYTFDSIDANVLSLPAMIELDDGISEPLLHEAYDHILEHFHEPVGYWSPELNDYVYRR